MTPDQWQEHQKTAIEETEEEDGGLSVTGDDGGLMDLGCAYGDRCLCPHPYHYRWECFTAEDAEAWAEAESAEERRRYAG